MATHEFNTFGMVYEAKNGKSYIELDAGRFNIGDVLEFHRPGKTGRRRQPALHIVFTIDGIGQTYEREMADVANGDASNIRERQRYYGTQTQTEE